MKLKKLLIHLYIYFLNAILGNYYSNSKEIFKFECEEQKANNFQKDLIYSSLSPEFSTINNDNLDDQANFNFEANEMEKIINPGEVQSLDLFKNFIYTFDINLSKISGDLLIHFYPLDCKIIIAGINIANNNTFEIERISNYEYGAYYVKVPKDELNITKFKIKTLKNSIQEYNYNRTLHLIINSFEYTNSNSNLTTKEKEPTLLNFNNLLDKINLLYNTSDTGNDLYPISFYFFIKERVEFKISISNTENKTIEKIIYYKDRIIIDRNFTHKNTYLKISIEKLEKEKDAVMISKAVGDYFKPIYFRKNILNIGFIPSGVYYQYYYMEIFKGEEGEITLNNKRYNGKLIAKLVKRGENNDSAIFNYSNYPRENESKLFDSKTDYLKYNDYAQKLILDLSKINDICKEDGCYLLISYYSIYFHKKEKNSKITGTEFSLVSCIFEEEEFRTQLINIPLNEYIIGSFDTKSINIHYYTIYIPDNSTDIIYELHYNNIVTSAEKGIKIFNPYKIKSFNRLEYGDLVINIQPKELKLKYFAGQYITFALSSYTNYLQIDNTYYYFRILQKKSDNNYLIYPLDTTKVNTCKTTKMNETFSCFYVIENKYNDLYNDLIINLIGKENRYYEIGLAEYNGNYYSIELEDLKYKVLNNYNNIKYTFFKFDNNSLSNSKFTLVKIQTNSSEINNISILVNFYDNSSFFPFFNLYSYQLVYLNYQENCSFYFDIITNNDYRFIVNNTIGTGEICGNNNCEYYKYYIKIQKRVLSFPITEEMKSILFLNNKDNDPLVFNAKFGGLFRNIIIAELTFSSNYRSELRELPIAYYLKEIDYKGADINIHFNLSNLNETIKERDIIIKGFEISYDIIKLLADRRFLKYDFVQPIMGKIDERSNYALIVFDTDKKENNKKDKYYLIVIDYERSNSKEISLEINANAKNDSQYSLPFNKYISGSFNLSNKEVLSQKYYINEEKRESKNCFTIEFSSNYENIGLDFTNSNIELNNNNRESNEGFYKYNVCINYAKGSENFIIVRLEGNNHISGDNKKYLKNVNYILRYYYKSNIEEVDHIFKFNAIKEFKNNSLTITITNENDCNTYSGNFKFTYIFYVYEKKRIIKNEVIKTIAPINSEKIYLNTTYDNKTFNQSIYTPDNLIYDEEYIGSAFIRVQNNDSSEESYYLYTFDIPKKKKKKKEIKLAEIIIAIIFVIITVIIIVICVKYRKIVKKNKSLEEKVNSISFSNKEEEINPEDTFPLI